MTDGKIPPAFYLVLSSAFVIEMKLLKHLVSFTFYEIIPLISSGCSSGNFTSTIERHISLIFFFFKFTASHKIANKAGGGVAE